MAAYLTARPPARDQWYTKRNRALTGCTVLHSSESAFDEMGVDTGAEGVAEFIRTRTTPGCYHDIVDSDSTIQLAEYQYGVYHDGTGSNNWALSLCFALRTTDWRRLSPAKRKAILRNGARAFLRQQDYRRRIGAPLTELRLITKAQSDAGMSGFTYHGYRDPGRRTDPGTKAPDLFPFDEFIAAIRAEMAGVTADPLDELEALMAGIYDKTITDQDGAQHSIAGALTLLVNATKSRVAVRPDNLTVQDGFGAALFTDNPGTPSQRVIRERDVLAELRANAATAAAAQGQIAGLSEALRQLAAAPGQKIDLAAVEAAAERGVAKGIEAIDVTVRRTEPS